ncbi:homocysteine methyltransferase [Sulfitobacter sp. JL08]|uniref:homocysteine S-methyltransferase family protein n=1 Tax=Sulfitobacter sp. JL08 TaxID=2070369 RepID=UPI000E0CB46D|nr:homocysteine S-methyltransferase family protein [Sulfitobacter sp. JL08]AXI53645.1 homocysteine methyltransferase [Sulfitobacter sp. JL08]
MSRAFLDSFPIILGEGSMYERLRRGGSEAFDPDIAYAGMLYDDIGRDMLAATHREYLDIGQRYGLPMVAGTPTWHSNAARVAKSAHVGKTINADACDFMKALRESYGPKAAPILIAGVTGPFGDGYKPEEAPGTAAAIDLHSPQIAELAEAGIDFFRVQTLPSVAEARGIAKVLASTGLPYVLSFVVCRDGCVLDGTPLDLAINAIDDETQIPPASYAVNCVHTSVFSSAYEMIHDRNATAAERVLGIDANTSAKTPEELDGLSEIDTEAPDDFGRNVSALHENFGIAYLGGCCGSSTEHIAALAAQCVSRREVSG